MELMVSYKLRSGDVALCATHGGGKGGSSAYDPQIGAATSAAAATAAKAEAFSEKLVIFWKERQQ